MSELKGEAKGEVLFVGETVQVSEKFSKREFAIKTQGEYPQELLFTLVKNNCGKVDNVSKGSFLEVKFNIKGKSWKTKEGETRFSNSLVAWFIKEESPFA